MYRPREAQQQTCKACQCQDYFNFHVPDHIWEQVVPEELRNRVVCLAYFDYFAAQKGVEYAPHLKTLYFAGNRGSFEFQVLRGITVGGLLSE